MMIRKFKANPFGWRGLAALYAATFLVIMLLAYTGNIPIQLSQIPYFDKAGHVVLYAIAVYLGHRVAGYRRIRLANWVVPLFPVLFGLFTITEEGLQGFSPNRSVDVGDLVASFLGIAVGFWLAEQGRKAEPK